MDDVERHEAIFPFGAQVSSKSRRRFCRGKENGPRWIEGGLGAFVRADNNRSYLDLTAGLGALTLGHRTCADTPRAYPLPTKEELILADKIQAMIPWAWRMRFLKNGGDATTAAIRLARVYTGRDEIVDFGNYHGCQDAFISEDHDGVPSCIRALTVRLAPTIENLARIDDRVAAVILEAAPLNPLPDGFLDALRARTARAGTVLIFDDVISGFRAHRQGAAGLAGVIPDLTCAGKAMGNGWPISVVYGNRDVMSCWERTHLSATHWAEPSAMTAAVDNLNQMIDAGFWELQKQWDFGGQVSNGYWSVLKLSDVEQTFVQSKLLDLGIITNMSQFFYLDLWEHRAQIENGFAQALGELEEAKAHGDVAPLLDCEPNRALFKRNA
jgi:glutamate-1-semialdehyde 2,1-aminomutase